MSWWWVLADWGWFGQLALTALPEETKRRPPLERWMTPRLHLLSGVLEAAGGTLLFVAASLAWIQGRPIGPRWLNLLPADGPASYVVGPFGFSSFLVTPLAWLCLYAMVEGVGRALEALFFDRMPGMALVVLPVRLGQKLVTATRRGQERVGALLAPPDRLSYPEGAAGERCELASYVRYAWEPGVTVAIQGKLWVLEAVQPLAEGGGHRFRYLFRALWPGEVIRGVVRSWDRQGEPGAGRRV